MNIFVVSVGREDSDNHHLVFTKKDKTELFPLLRNTLRNPMLLNVIPVPYCEDKHGALVTDKKFKTLYVETAEGALYPKPLQKGNGEQDKTAWLSVAHLLAEHKAQPSAPAFGATAVFPAPTR